MSKGIRVLSAEERDLWGRVVRGVRGRRVVVQVEAPVDEKALVARPALKRAASPPAGNSKPSAATAKAGPLENRLGERRVRRGKLSIDGKLDLHGETFDSGFAALSRFLIAAASRGARTVIVVTGKGRTGEGVLKRALPGWLATPDLRALVSGYAPAHRDHGGAGAFYVFLKRRED